MSNVFYVYAWLRPCGTPFYIGKGKGRRDVSTQRSRAFKCVVGEITSTGAAPKVVRIADNLNESDAFELEAEEIYKYGRIDCGTGVLVNQSDGGEGASGTIMSAETRAKISRLMKGKPKSAEHKAKVSAAKRGGTLSAEHRAKIGAAQKGRPKSATQRARTSASNMGKKRSQETRDKNRAARIGKTLSEETKAKVVSALRLAPPRAWSYRGISRSPTKSTRWRAHINANGKQINLGSFATQEDAAIAYNKAALGLWGEGNCYLNVITANDNQPKPASRSRT